MKESQVQKNLKSAEKVNSQLLKKNLNEVPELVEQEINLHNTNPLYIKITESEIEALR